MTTLGALCALCATIACERPASPSGDCGGKCGEYVVQGMVAAVEQASEQNTVPRVVQYMA